jgi:hypothetical protein
MIGATKRGLTSLDVYNNPAGYRKLLSLLMFFQARNVLVFARRAAQFRAMRPANLAP